MKLNRFIMEDWLALYKDSCRYDLGESGFPDITVAEFLNRCGKTTESLGDIILKDNDTRGTERLRNAIAKTYHKTVNVDTVTVTTGTSEALFILFNLLLGHGKSAVVPFPSFQALYEIPRGIEARLKWYRLRPENGYIPDPDELCELIDDTTGVVVINTPHNPSGVLMPQDISEAVIQKAARHGAVVLADEHYRFLPLSGSYPIPSLARPDENVIATGSITKCFGVIGLRMGWIVAPPALVSKICGFRDYLTHTLSPISDYLAALALENAPSFLEPNIAVLRDNAAELVSAVEKTPGLSLVPPEGGVVAFPQYEYDISSEDFALGLIEQHGVFVLPGSAFETERHFRINLGQSPSEFRKALEFLKDYCRKITIKRSG